MSKAMTQYWTSFARAGTPEAAGQPAWPPFGPAHAYMAFTGQPDPSENLLPGMYELHEATMCRRRASGDTAWNWNVGLLSPPLPAKAAGCR